MSFPEAARVQGICSRLFVWPTARGPAFGLLGNSMSICVIQRIQCRLLAVLHPGSAPRDPWADGTAQELLRVDAIQDAILSWGSLPRPAPPVWTPRRGGTAGPIQTQLRWAPMQAPLATGSSSLPVMQPVTGPPAPAAARTQSRQTLLRASGLPVLPPPDCASARRMLKGEEDHSFQPEGWDPASSAPHPVLRRTLRRPSCTKRSLPPPLVRRRLLVKIAPRDALAFPAPAAPSAGCLPP